MEKDKTFIEPEWCKKFKNIRCGFTLPILGNFALTRKSIYSGRTTQENRINLASILNVEKNMVFSPKQTHSDIIINVEESLIGKGVYDLKGAIEGDACFTKIKNLLLFTTYADCVPVIIFDSKLKVAGTVHSGWRGIQKNIIKRIIDKYKDFGSTKDSIYVAIGPAIHDCCYKVGDDFIENFKDSSVKEFFKIKNKEFFFNPAKAVLKQLLEEDIKQENIDFIDKCTCCSLDPSFFSCRKDGRDFFESQAAFIVMYE